MMKIEFANNNNNTYDVRAMKSDTDWDKVGVLEFDKDQNAWVLWTGTSYSDDDYMKAQTGSIWSDSGTTYDKNLDEAKEDIIADLED